MERGRKAMSIVTIAGGMVVGGIGAGCTGAEQSAWTGGNTGIALDMDIRGPTDVADMHFALQPVDCASGAALAIEPVEAVRDLEDILLPGGLPPFEDAPLDSGSEHVFADAFLSLAPGCYDVTTTPLRMDGSPSASCAPAVLRRVEVIMGATTEVLLINQCSSQGPGAVDVISTLNHAPVLQAVYYERSKFGLRCESQVVCATALDTDHDPLAWSWEQTGNPLLALAGPHEVTTETNEDGSVTQCVSFMPQEPGHYEFTVTVYDLIHDHDGSLIRIEDWLASEGYAGASHASLRFPFYASPEGREPAVEVCDGVDNDCDGEVDEEPVDVGMACTPWDSAPIGGACIPGEIVCEVGERWCVGYVGPEDEVCDNGVDDDCDGETDEACSGECGPGEVLVCESPLDLVLLEDLSGSFDDDVGSVRALVPNLFHEIRAGEPTATFGLASFVDKPFHPHGSTGDYIYRRELRLVGDLSALQDAVDGLRTRRGGDLRESQIEALMLLARSTSGYGFRPAATRYVVLCTDAPYHLAGDCPSCVGNNGDGFADPNEDYPSVAQVRSALVDAGIIPIFAVTAARVPIYEQLVAELGIEGAVVTTLASDSSNLVDAILDGIRETCTCQPAGPSVPPMPPELEDPAGSRGPGTR